MLMRLYNVYSWAAAAIAGAGLLFILVFVLVRIISDRDFRSKSIYALQYDFPFDSIFIENKRPYDCDYNTTPLGEKRCHYELEVLSSYKGRKKIITSDDGERIIHRLTCSYDLGKTWKYDDCLKKNSPDRLFLGWKRVED